MIVQLTTLCRIKATAIDHQLPHKLRLQPILCRVIHPHQHGLGVTTVEERKG